MSDPFRPTTIRVDPQMAGLPDTYISERAVADETEPPQRGSNVGSFLPGYSSHFVIGSQVLNRPGGRTIQVTHCAGPGWAILNGSERIRELNVVVGYTTQIVPAPSAGEVIADPYTEYTPISDTLSQKRVQAIPTEALNAFYQSFPSRVNLDIPKILVSASVVWNTPSAVGNFQTEWEGLATGVSRSLAGSESGNAQSSGAVLPDLSLQFRDIQSNNLPATSHYFFLPNPVTAASLLSGLANKAGAVSAWPVFKPRSDTVVMKGMKIAVEARASGNAAYSTGDNDLTFSKDRTQGQGANYDVSPVNVTVDIPPCIHPAISIANATAPVLNVTAAAAVGWSGTGGLPSVNANAAASGTATGSVTPLTIPATVPDIVPTSGRYLVDARVEPFDYGYSRVFCETIDAAIFA